MEDEIDEIYDEEVTPGPEVPIVLDVYIQKRVDQAQAITGNIINYAYRGAKDLTAVCDPHLVAGIYKDIYMSLEVTARELAKARMQNQGRGGGGQSSQGSSGPSQDDLKQKVYNWIQANEYGYPDKIAKALHLNESQVVKACEGLKASGSIYQAKKGYYSMPKF